MTGPHTPEPSALPVRLDLRRYADRRLGEHVWFLLCCYSRMTSAPFVGTYVSGLTTEVARGIVDTLARGERVPVHLMHRHVSGNHQSSALQLRHGVLVMIFDDREEFA